jgi:hypothetical protein
MFNCFPMEEGLLRGTPQESVALTRPASGAPGSEEIDSLADAEQFLQEAVNARNGTHVEMLAARRIIAA